MADELDILDGTAEPAEEEATVEDTKEDAEEAEAEPEETDEEADEDSEEEPEEEEEEEEEPELDQKVLTSWTDIKTKYPNFSKEFPDIKNALFREQAFSEVFTNPAEAKETLEKAQTFDQLSQDIVGAGNISDLFETIKTQNKESFEKIAYSLLPYFQEQDRDLYYEIASRPIKQLLRAAWNDGGGERTDLGKAAAHIHKYFFKNLNFEEKVKSENLKEAPAKSRREQELEQRLSQIESGKQNEFLASVDNSYISKMSHHIREGIDKDERLTEWSKAKIAEDVLREVQIQLKKDSRYIGAVNSLVRQAGQSGYSNDFKSRIINAALARAKSLVPEIRKRVVGEALKARGSRESRESRESKNGNVKPRLSNYRSSSSGSSSKSSKKPMSDIDILRG
jgi:hypothetical protein